MLEHGCDAGMSIVVVHVSGCAHCTISSFWMLEAV